MSGIPMRRQADNQPPPRSSRARWRQSLREALALVSPQVTNPRGEQWHRLTVLEQTLMLHTDNWIVRAPRAIRIGGAVHDNIGFKHYQIDERPASQLEIQLWAQAVAALGRLPVEDPDLTKEKLDELYKLAQKAAETLNIPPFLTDKDESP